MVTDLLNQFARFHRRNHAGFTQILHKIAGGLREGDTWLLVGKKPQ